MKIEQLYIYLGSRRIIIIQNTQRRSVGDCVNSC